MLNDRQQRILQAIIDDYINTAEPIGSRTIARKSGLGISPATIRNEMADLELMGFIEQPHTSSGRVPSAKGYRFYVDCLLSPPELSEHDMAMIQTWYDAKVRRVEQVFQETAKILSRMTHNVSMVIAPQVAQSSFRYLQFLPLDEHRSILVIVTDTGFVENKIIEIPDGMTLTELQRIAMSINERLRGLTFDQIKSSVLREIRQDIVHNTSILDTTMEVIQNAIHTDQKDRVYLGGTTQLLDQPEFRDVGKARSLLTMLEQDKLLCDIIESHNSSGVVVTIGEENKFSGIQDCSVVQATYQVEGQVIGTIAILGPTRMEYGKIMSVLEFMQRHFGELLKKYKI